MALFESGIHIHGYIYRLTGLALLSKQTKPLTHCQSRTRDAHVLRCRPNYIVNQQELFSTKLKVLYDVVLLHANNVQFNDVVSQHKNMCTMRIKNENIHYITTLFYLNDE